MKKLLLILILAVTTVFAKAQLKLGIKAGWNNSNFAGKDVEGNSAKSGFNAGLYAEWSVGGMFSIKPEMTFSAMGIKYEMDGMSQKLDMNYLNAPLIAKLTLPFGLFVETGPQFGILMNAYLKGEDAREDVKALFNKADLTWIMGVGFVTKAHIGMNARFNMGLNKVYDYDAVKAYNRVLQVGLFYEFKH